MRPVCTSLCLLVLSAFTAAATTAPPDGVLNGAGSQDLVFACGYGRHEPAGLSAADLLRSSPELTALETISSEVLPAGEPPIAAFAEAAQPMAEPDLPSPGGTAVALSLLSLAGLLLVAGRR